jgi:hypothetical protein
MKTSRGFRSVVIAVVMILLPVAAWAVWDYVEASRLASRIRTIREKGEPIAAHELQPPPLPLNDEQKRASRYYLAAAMLLLDVEPGSLTARDVEHFGEALTLLDRATSLEFSHLQPGTEFSYRTAGFLHLARLNSVRTESLARAGKGDEAASALVASIRLRRVMDTLFPPVDWSFIDRKDFLAALRTTLGDATPSADALQRVQNALEKVVQPGAMEDGIVTLRGVAIQRYWLHAYGGTVDPPVRGTAARLNLSEWVARPWFTNRFMSTLEIVDERLQAARVPWPDKLAAIDALKQAAETESASPTAGAARRRTNQRWWIESPIADLGKPSSVRRVADRVASDGAAITALAIERFRRAHEGRMPASLAELSPAFLKSISADPFSGKPLLYRQEGTGYIVYSVGENRADDRGSVDANGADVGLRVSTRQR